jgi:hypothetical protein
VQEDTQLADALRDLAKAFGSNPTDVIQRVEYELPGLPTEPQAFKDYLEAANFSPSTLRAALEVKRISGQINVLVHAAGILTSLPYILESGEKVISVSLGAGNSGKEFDLETDRRVAEFKFISWRGGPESIRQNQIFKDLLKLLKDSSGRRKQLFLTGTAEALRFLRGGRALDSVLSRNVKLKAEFLSTYGGRFSRVAEFYREVETLVEICDLRQIAPAFARIEVPTEETTLDEL